MSDKEAKSKKEEDFMKTLDNLEAIERRETVDNFKAEHVIGGGSGDNDKRNMSDMSSIMPLETQTNYRPNDSMASLADMMNNHKFGQEKESKPEANPKVPGLNLDI